MHCIPKTRSLIRLVLPTLLCTTALAQSWAQRTLTIAPSARNSSANCMAYDPARGVSLLFGGYQGNPVPLADTWEWNGTSWTQRSFANGPVGRWGHGLVQDTRRGRAVMFGGYVASTGHFTNETWEWDGSAWTQILSPTSPSPRGYSGMAYDSVLGRTVVFGGYNGSGYLGDTWTFDGASWTQVQPTLSPSGRQGASMAYDSVRAQAVLFGGATSSGVLGDTWTFDGANWSQRTPSTSPSARQSGSMCFDALSGRTLLHGGADATFAVNSGETWSWDGLNWSLTTSTGPAPRHGAAMACDLQRGQIVLFGGNGATLLGDTWEFATPGVRTMTTVTPPVVGSPAVFRYDYPPTSGTGNLYVHLLTARFVGSYPVNIPGFTSLGLSRCDLTNIFLQTSGFLGASGQERWTVQIPADNFLAGLQFDVQSVDLSLLTNTIFWASNDAEVVIAPATPQPNPVLNMVAIQPGTFMMGSTAVGGTAAPVHAVTITRPFWVGKYEVTQAEYRAVTGTNPSVFQGASYPNAPQRPVDRVSWNDAMAYCSALTATEAAAGRIPSGYQYRLPTEAEWEYVCRAGTTTEWNTGASLVCGQANIAFCGPAQTTVVGSYPANAWGVFDMHGNVWEWCLDSWDGTSNYPSSAVSDPYVSSGSFRVKRGGSVGNSADGCRSAVRLSQSPGNSLVLFGFRVCLAPIRMLVEPNPALNMVAIQPGTFQMGSAGISTASPVHAVTITRPFWVGKYEVTQAQYQAVRGSNPSFHQGASFPNAPQRPVERVTWIDAVVYCNILTYNENLAGRIPAGYAYRLPTEAEWEYVCRAGTTTDFNTGASLLCGQANFSGCGLGQTTVVGSYPANPWGLFDTHGNVIEWCLDSWDATANYPSSPVVDPLVGSGPRRVLRGGSWVDPAGIARSAFRGNQFGPTVNSSFGFRVVLAPAAPPNPALNMVAIQPGTFQMGSTAVGDAAAPVHAVTITRPFWVGRYEVTQAEYQAVMGSNPSLFQGPSYPNDPQRPVEQVTWSNAMAYCAALTATETAAGRIPAGYQYRLPTEAEWEYCCRAGTTTEFSFGPSLACGMANFYGSGIASCVGITTSVGSYPANPWGLFDTHGNVGEWCLDSWDGTFNYPSSMVSDPYVSSGSFRVTRGGGWGDGSDWCRSAFRSSLAPSFPYYLVGFRVVLAPALVP